MKKIAVITSTIGRETLKICLDSVRAQSASYQHYVFVDGKQYHAQVKELEALYPEVIFTYLPMNKGANGWTNSAINAIAPFLIEEELITYLDDDNAYADGHLNSLINIFEQNPQVEMAHSLRFFCDKNLQIISKDNYESLGNWRLNAVNFPLQYKNKSINVFLNLNYSKNHIDTNCMAFRSNLARYLAPTWTTHKLNDRSVFEHFLNMRLPFACTGKYSVYYRTETFKQWNFENEILQFFAISQAEIEDFVLDYARQLANHIESAYPEKVWEQEMIFEFQNQEES